MFFTNTLRAVALLLVLCLPPVANAICHSTLHYVNGVMNSDDTDLIRITEFFRKELKDDPNLCVGEPLFNPSQKMLMDLAENYKLRLDLGKSLWPQIVDGFVAGLLHVFNNLLAMVRGEKTDIYGYKADLESMYAKLKPELMAGNGHVLLPHSEGNLLAIRLREMAVADGYSADKIAIMHVAAPIKVALTVQRAATVLSSQDTIIKSHSLLFDANKPNFVPDLAQQPEMGHGMLAVYLNPDNMGTFTNFSCKKSQTTPLSVIVESIRRAAQCQFGTCVNLSFSNGEC